MHVPWENKHRGPIRAAATTAAAAGHPAAAAGTISTIAGGVGGPGRATGVGLGPNAPCGVSYAAGRAYIADTNAVREVNPQTDALTTPAGTALDGAPRVNRPATEASGLGTCSVVTDTSGNLIMATGREQIMMVPGCALG